MIAPNAYKGSLDAARAAVAIAEGVERGFPDADCRLLPMADGGDGTLDVLLAASGRGRTEMLTVTGPLQQPVRARLGWINDTHAVVEMAEAAGLRLLDATVLSPLRASSRGVGELILAALDRGAVEITLGVGGSASTDGGAGIVEALGARLLDASGHPVPPGGGALHALAQLDLEDLDPRLRAVRIRVACDVDSPLLGSGGAAARFAPQKGASAAEVALLEEGLRRWAEAVVAATGRDHQATPGAGAAGGVGFGLAAVMHAELLPGAGLVAEAVGLDAVLAIADVAITGEGQLDASTGAGKAPAEVLRRARAASIPCGALVGRLVGPAAGFDAVLAFGDGHSREESMREVTSLLRVTAPTIVATLLAGRRPQ